MKRSERHHLKENELENLTRQAREMVEARKREVTAAVIVIAVIAAIGLGYLAWRQQMQSKAHALLAQAEDVMDAPIATAGQFQPGSYATEQSRADAALAKFKTVADAYPSTDAGVFARYQEAALLVQLGRPAEAVATYQQVVEHAGSGVYGEMARLGVAEAQVRSGQYRAGHHDLQGSRPAQGRRASRGRDPDAARSHVRGRRQDGRRAADLQPSGRGIPGLTLHG